ncbi:carbohydrate ABC transporter permease [Catenulispora subtropica]|uniref:Carbohydrate ABC transporter permease n=1 Tax=Catenulispora subtropica TaxID=450798 RepID=A0ABP5C389_9ACTN
MADHSSTSPALRRGPVGRLLQYVALAGYVVFLGFPLLWLLSTAFKSAPELVSLHPTLIPREPTLSNFSTAFREQNLVRAAWNSLRVSVASSLLTTVVAVPAAYALARYRTVLRRVSLVWILVSQVFPVILVVVPLFLILQQLGIGDSLIGLILAYLVWLLPFALWMLQSYVRTIPVELEQAAAVDGAGKLRTLVSVVLPLLGPGIAITVLFTFISAWNEFFFALVLLQNPHLATLPLTLARFVGSEGIVALGPLAAGALLATLPGLLVFALLQRRISSGLLSGAVKG